MAGPSDGQLSLADLEMVQVIGKGAGGVVQLVRHKWTNEIYALKVMLHPHLFFCLIFRS